MEDTLNRLILKPASLSPIIKSVQSDEICFDCFCWSERKQKQNSCCCLPYNKVCFPKYLKGDLILIQKLYRVFLAPCSAE